MLSTIVQSFYLMQRNSGGREFSPPPSVPGLGKGGEQVIPLWPDAAGAARHPTGHLDELLIVDLDQSGRVCWQLLPLLFVQAIAELLVFPGTYDILDVQVLCVLDMSPFL